MHAFIKEAKVIIEQENDGTAAIAKLITTVNDMISTTKEIDVNRKAMLNDINADLTKIQTSFTKGLDLDLMPSVTRKGPVAMTAGSFLAGSVAFLFYVLLGRMVASARLKLKNE